VKIKKRQMIGMALMAASVVAAILIQAFTGLVLEIHTIHTDSIVSDGFIIFHWRYAIPLAAVFNIGFRTIS
jgi:hypothetical protein